MTLRTLSTLTVLLSATLGCATVDEHDAGARQAPPPTVEYIAPEGLHSNPAFSQVIAVEGPHRTVFVGGQNAVDATGSIVGSGDLAAQSEQVARNLRTALEAGGAELSDVVRWTVYLVQGQSPMVAFQTFHEVLGASPNPPTISVLQVSALAHPEFLIEVDAIAVVPLPGQ